MKKNKLNTVISCFLSLFLLPVSLVNAGEADVLEVKAVCYDANNCRFRVRVQHGDEGWDHYVNRWEVVSPSGEVLATRVLAHPHVEEQPFSRSLTAQIAPEIKFVLIRAHDSVHGLGGQEMTVVLRD